MTVKKYIDYKFLGVHSFIEMLKSTGSEYRVFGEDDYASLYEIEGEILKKDEDTVVSGIVTREGQQAYFTEFGIRITKSYRSYIVFIFDHHPRVDELGVIARELEGIIAGNLDQVDISQFTGATGRELQ